MVVTTDLGEWNDIHPLNKEDVGKRLALQAQKLAYGETDITASGPIPERVEFGKDTVTIYFKYTGKGLTIKKGDELEYFALSDGGDTFEWANAKIVGNTVKVWNPLVSYPTKVRYGWADNPAKANLYNKNGLPATPFELSK